MKVLYRIIIAAAKAGLPLIGLFNKKINLGAKGRGATWDILDKKVKKTTPKIWVHAASLGEFEQVVPVLEKINREKYQVVLSFFSPSGYENKKHTSLADVVCYLPLDTRTNAQKFIKVVDPSLAIMVKYEFWPQYLNQLKLKKIHTILVSGVFREKMPFNSWYGKWMTPSLEAFSHFFLQDEHSLYHLKNLGYTNATVSGDTRFDRASQLIERSNHLDFLDEFLANKKCLVVGSSWPEDISVMKNWLNSNSQNENYKVIIAPHEVHSNAIKQLIDQLDHPVQLYSEIEKNKVVEETTILIIDSIGKLTLAYSYASIAYVGGAMGTKGLHNILEAATFGIPVVIGKNYEKFPEAGKLEDLGGLFSIENKQEFNEIINKLFEDDYLRDKTGMISGHWINSNTGATRLILNYLKEYNEDMVVHN